MITIFLEDLPKPTRMIFSNLSADGRINSEIRLPIAVYQNLSGYNPNKFL